MLTFRPLFHAPITPRNLDILLECLTLLDLHWLHSNPDTPLLYESGVFYQREPDGQENWLTVPYVIEQGFGDCEDLACWRAAELRLQGIVARPFASKVVNSDGTVQFHARVRLGNNAVEDPSRRLGM